MVLVKAIRALVKDITDAKDSIPSKESVIGVVEGVTTLLSAKVIDIPGVDEDAVVASIEELTNVILGKVK